MSDRVGQYIGNYRLLRLLGQGGFAQVYLGEHRYLKSAAALKVLERSLTEQEAQRFLEEAQTLVHLRHAHIVRVLDFAVERGTPVLVMDYVPGGTLRQRYPRGTCLPLEMTVEYVKQVAAALQYAHNHHLIHRDVKPDNLLLDADERLVLSDFGLALFAPSPDLLSTQALVGTLLYIAPEQVRGKPGFASDQYALGVLTYEWLTGVRPFEGSAWQLIEQHLTALPPPLRERCPDLPVSVERVVLRALAKNPQDRYVSVWAFAQALERACQESRPHEEDSQITAPLLAAPGSSAPTLARSGRHTPRTIFLSAAPSDEPVAARLAADLSRRGVVLSNDLPGGLTGADQEEAVRQAMRAVQRVVVVVTPQTRSSRLVREHLRLAQMYQRRLVLVWVQGEEMATIRLNHPGQQLLPVEVLDARGFRYQTALEELLVCLRDDTRLSPDEEATLSIAPAESRDPRNPYKGLRAFTAEDAGDFFGRDQLVDELVKDIAGMLGPTPPASESGRLLTLIGPSGSGKSSLLMAGLLPKLQHGALPGSEAWVYLEPIVPGKHPIEALALTLKPHFPDSSFKTLREDLEDDATRGLHLLAMQLVKQQGSCAVLLVDQFEELFTQKESEEERRRFIDLLLIACTEPRGSLLVLLTLRADFYDRPMHYPELREQMQAHLRLVPPMEIGDLRATIEQPAALPDVQLTFEGNLVGDLLFETQGQVGALPLLEFTLDQLFQHRDGQTLTMVAYQKIGGVKGALAKHAEATYTALPSGEHRRLARALFLRLIDPGMSEQDTTRRRASLAELSLPDAKQTVILQEVAAAFITARLLTTNEVAGTTTIEVSHEALIREWPRLFEWLREGREDIHLQQAMSRDVAEWERRGKPKDRLYRGAQLTEAQAWARRNMPSRNEVAFLQESATRRLRSRIAVTTIVLLILLLSIPAEVLVRSFLLTNVVTTLSDDGPGSLRRIIDTAQQGSTITFATNLVGGTIMLTNDLKISKNLTIRGPVAGILSISGGKNGHRVYVESGARVDISGLTFKDSQTSIGIIFNDGGMLTLTNSIVSGNTGGGGITNNPGGTLILTNSTVSSNTASISAGNTGGGIYNSGILFLTNSTVSGNTATGNGSGGGGIYNKGTLILTNSTVSGNTTTGDGGGISNIGTLILINSTVSGNTATGRDSQGGGIFIQSSVDARGTSSTAQANLTFSTMYGNGAPGGADIAVKDLTGSSNGKPTPTKQISQVKISNSIVAADPAHPGPDMVGTLTSSGYNLFQDNSGATFDPATSMQHSTDKTLSVNEMTSVFASPVGLRDNGGPTKTYALLPDASNPAMNKVPLDACQITIPERDVSGTPIAQYTLTTDQRGRKRPDGNEQFCDIGAYEYVPGG